MVNWDKITSSDYFNLELKERVEFYVDMLIIRPFDNSDSPVIFKEHYSGIMNILYDGLENRKPDQKISSNLGNYTKDWGIDWLWIVHHISLDYYNILRAKEILKFSGKDAIVYKLVDKNACVTAKKLYLKDNTTNQPKIFELQNLINNRHNLTFGIKEFKPVIGATIFEYNDYAESFNWDNSYLMSLPPYYYWDKNKQSFVPKSVSRNKIIKHLGGYFETNKVITENEIKIKIRFVKIRDLKKKMNLLEIIKNVFK